MAILRLHQSRYSLAGFFACLYNPTHLNDKLKPVQWLKIGAWRAPTEHLSATTARSGTKSHTTSVEALHYARLAQASRPSQTTIFPRNKVIPSTWQLCFGRPFCRGRNVREPICWVPRLSHRRERGQDHASPELKPQYYHLHADGRVHQLSLFGS